MIMLRRMTVRRAIATTDMTALKTMPEMHPLAASFETFFAAFSLRLFRSEVG